MDALDILTEDCWREVFKKVWGPEDLKSCCEACTTFQGILERKKNAWMFHAVLPLVLQYLSVPNRPGVNVRRRLWRSNDWDAMYTCRRVCKSWRQSVDQYLETHNNYFDGIAAPIPREYLFLTAVRIQEFSEMYEEFAGNPFIGRSIYIHLPGLFTPEQVEPNQDQQDDYNVNLRQLLIRFGSEILSLTSQYFMWDEQLSFCKSIQILLRMLPNLRSLHLGYGGENVDRLHRFLRWNPELRQLPAFLAANPLPDHPNLESLVLDALHVEMTGPLLEQYGPQLKRLQLLEPKHFAEKVGRFQCLKELEIWSRDAKESLKALRRLRSPLSILQIHVRYDDLRNTWPIHELIQNILHLPLTDLRISSSNYIERALGAFPASLQQNSVQRVRITSYTPSSLSCNFLRCFPNLEKIHFEYPIGIPKPGSPNNLLSEEDVYESEVWEALPHLQSIAVKSYYPRMQKEYRRSTVEGLRLEKTKELLADLF